MSLPGLFSKLPIVSAFGAGLPLSSEPLPVLTDVPPKSFLLDATGDFPESAWSLLSAVFLILYSFTVSLVSAFASAFAAAVAACCFFSALLDAPNVKTLVTALLTPLKILL